VRPRVARTVAVGVLALALPGQIVVGIDDLDPTTGTSNSIPWGQANGYTSLQVYSAATLRSFGLCAGVTLTEFAVAPSSGSSGTYTAPQAIVQIGHLAQSPPTPGAWWTQLAAPITVHDLAMGPYTFAWSLNTYTPLPGFAAAGFVWDGVRDVGFAMTTSSGTTGTFSARRTGTQLRHGIAIFNATTQAPSTNSNAAMEVRMTWSHGPNACATRTTYGSGCYDGYLTWYENFAGLGAFDFAGSIGNEQVLAAFPIGPLGHLVAAVPAAWSPPTGTPVLNNDSPPVAMTDESYSGPLVLPFSFPFPGGSTNVIHAAANGYVLLGSTTSNASDFTPTASEMVAQQPARLCPLWSDLHPAINTATNPASGVYFHVDASQQTAYVTWLDVADGRAVAPASGATSVTMQCALHQNGAFEFRYRNIVPAPTGIGAVLVGWSQGNVAGIFARDPGSIDLSATMPFATTGPDEAPLTLNSNHPALGTTFTLTTTNVPAAVPVAALFFGTAQVPGVDLGSSGAPGCRVYTTADVLAATIAGAGSTISASIPVPFTTTLVGAMMTTQSAAFSTRNALGATTSNGLEWTIGF